MSGNISAPSSAISQEADTQPTILARNVTKTFGGGVTALQDVSFDVQRGEFVSVVGASGCGKSTLLRLGAGLTEVTAGSMQINGQDVTGPRQDIGLMFQRPTLLQWRTALENVLLPCLLRGERVGEKRKEAYELLELLGLSGFEHMYPSHLSGGMQQRVALARLLIMGVDILLLDEPFAAVDELTRERLNLELLKIHKRTGASILLVTHNIGEAVLLADRVIVMTPHPGQIADVLSVPLPRPRTPSMAREPEIQDLILRVREGLGFSDVEFLDQ